MVHLVRAQNEVESFAKFFESYLQNPGGIEHDLLIIFKGFANIESKDEYLSLLGSTKYMVMDVPDVGFDITAYFAAAKQYADRYRYFCFLNSFSVIQDRGWLMKLHQYIILPDVGMVGATGSWQSHRPPRFLGAVLADVAIQHYELHQDKAVWKRWILGGAAALQLGRLLYETRPFPNYHLRTNAFMLSGETMMKLDYPEITTKYDAYRFESGKKGLTMQILRRKLKVLVVGKDGKCYDMDRWHESKTFWQFEQENLLVEDNQTRMYRLGDAQKRASLVNNAWGDRPAFAKRVSV